MSLRDFFNDAKHLELLLVARLFDLTLFFERSGEGDFMLLGVKGIVKLFQASNDVFENSLLLSSNDKFSLHSNLLLKSVITPNDL